MPFKDELKSSFKAPVDAALTESQNKALAKLGSINTFLNAPLSFFQDLPKVDQMSIFDYGIKSLESLVGSATPEAILQQFLGKIFDQVGADKTVLEEMIIKALAKGLDASGIVLGQNLNFQSVLDSGANLASNIGSNISGAVSNIGSNSGDTSSSNSDENTTNESLEGDIPSQQEISENWPEIRTRNTYQYRYLTQIAYDDETGDSLGIEVTAESNSDLPLYKDIVSHTAGSHNAAVAYVKDMLDTRGPIQNGIVYPLTGTLLPGAEPEEVVNETPESTSGSTNGSTGLTGNNISTDNNIETSGSTSGSTTNAPIEEEEEIPVADNEAFLMERLLPVLTIGKRLLAKQIITMMFGPKELMHSDPAIQEKLIESSACGEKMFSVSNNPSISGKELEFNRVKLREELENGGIELNISCQKVIIKLPENFEEQFDLEDSETIGIPEDQRPNPSTSFVLLSNFIQSEVRSQRNAEDSTTVKRSFFQLLIDKIMSTISVALSVDPAMAEVLSLINLNLNQEGEDGEVSDSSIISNPCEISDLCESGQVEEFEKKSAFSKQMIDSLYSLVASMIVKKLISVGKDMIKKVLVEKAREKIEKLRARQENKFKYLNAAVENAEKARQYAASLQQIQALFEFFRSQSQNQNQS